MKLLRELHGRELARLLCARWNDRIGTLNAILRQGADAKGVPREDLLATLS